MYLDVIPSSLCEKSSKKELCNKFASFAADQLVYFETLNLLTVAVKEWIFISFQAHCVNKQEEALQSELSLAMAVAALLRNVAGLLDGVCSGTDGTGRPNAIHHRPAQQASVHQ